MNDAIETILSRLEDLELRLAFQDDTIASLNDVLVQHHNRINDLELTLGLLVERLREAQPNTFDEPTEEPPPPHY